MPLKYFGTGQSLLTIHHLKYFLCHISNLWQNFMLASCVHLQVLPFGTFCARHAFLGCVTFSSLTATEQFYSVGEAQICHEVHVTMEPVPYGHRRCQNMTGQNQRVTSFKSIIHTRKDFQEANRSSHYVFKAAHEDMLQCKL
jgi:hypothetical protein